MVALVAHRAVHLRGQNDAFATAGDGFANHLFGLAPALPVGGVDEVDPGARRAASTMVVTSSWVVPPSLPKFIAPSTSELTCTPVRPRVRYCMTVFLHGILRKWSTAPILLYGTLFRLSSYCLRE
jgi:hypothetical protein